MTWHLPYISPLALTIAGEIHTFTGKRRRSWRCVSLYSEAVFFNQKTYSLGRCPRGHVSDFFLCVIISNFCCVNLPIVGLGLSLALVIFDSTTFCDHAKQEKGAEATRVRRPGLKKKNVQGKISHYIADIYCVRLFSTVYTTFSAAHLQIALKLQISWRRIGKKRGRVDLPPASSRGKSSES